MTMPPFPPLSGRVMDSVSFLMNFVQWFTKVHFTKAKWQQIFNSSHSKEIRKQCMEVYCKIFISVSLREIFLPKSTNCPPFWINF